MLQKFCIIYTYFFAHYEKDCKIMRKLRTLSFEQKLPEIIIFGRRMEFVSQFSVIKVDLFRVCLL